MVAHKPMLHRGNMKKIDEFIINHGHLIIFGLGVLWIFCEGMKRIDPCGIMLRQWLGLC